MDFVVSTLPSFLPFFSYAYQLFPRLPSNEISKPQDPHHENPAAAAAGAPSKDEK